MTPFNLIKTCHDLLVDDFSKYGADKLKCLPLGTSRSKLYLGRGLPLISLHQAVI